MFAVSRRYRFDPKSSEQINNEIQKSFVPLLRSVPGFVAYYWLDNGEGLGESLTVFKSKMGAEASVKMAASWVKIHQLFDLLGTPEIVQGEVRAHGTAESES